MSKQLAHSKRDWHPADIKAAIAKKGATMADLARHHGYTTATSFYNAMRIPYPKVERIIADFLDMRPEDIWPSRYAEKKLVFNTPPAHRAREKQQEVA